MQAQASCHMQDAASVREGGPSFPTLLRCQHESALRACRCTSESHFNASPFSRMRKRPRGWQVQLSCNMLDLFVAWWFVFVTETALKDV